MYWSSPRECPDTTEDLYKNPDFSALDDASKREIIKYGNLCKRYGMGEYQEIGQNAKLYNQFVFDGGIPNPFKDNKGEAEPSRE